MSAHTQPGKPSEPIPINTASLHSRTGRTRSASVSSGSSASTSSSTEPPTPLSASATQLPRIGIPSPGSSPILSYFLQSPTKTPGTATFPFKRKFGTAPVFEEDEEVPVAAHARRASTAVAGRFAQPQPQMTPLPDQHLERGAGLLRRLSLSSAAFTKPQAGDTRNGAPPSPPPNTAVSPTAKTMPFAREGIKTKPHRSATLGGDAARPRRAPSPMGERILKGHFDGFN